MIINLKILNEFWDEVAKKYTNCDEIYPDWFKGGKLNTCYNVLDIHINNPLKKGSNLTSNLNKLIEISNFKPNLEITHIYRNDDNGYIKLESVLNFKNHSMNMHVNPK
ncbi:hypothetical protein ACTFIW_011194 [Dictyostelium discoideum]